MISAGGMFKYHTDTELYRSAEGFAAAQEQLAALSKEDMTHWHHIAIKELIVELGRRLIMPPSARTEGTLAVAVSVERARCAQIARSWVHGTPTTTTETVVEAIAQAIDDGTVP